LGEELADVVITTYVCAKVCGIDLWKAVERKLDMEIERWQKFEQEYPAHPLRRNGY
jgi:NTP pyrophosphatase (non-canonical NTP hydrolase)